MDGSSTRRRYFSGPNASTWAKGAEPLQHGGESEKIHSDERKSGEGRYHVTGEEQRITLQTHKSKMANRKRDLRGIGTRLEIGNKLVIFHGARNLYLAISEAWKQLDGGTDSPQTGGVLKHFLIATRRKPN